MTWHTSLNVYNSAGVNEELDDMCLSSATSREERLATVEIDIRAGV